MKLDSDRHAAQDPGDDSAVLRFYARWAPSVADVTRAKLGTEPLAHVYEQGGDEGGGWMLALSLDRGDSHRQHHFIAVLGPSSWPMARLAPGVWDLPRSIHVPGYFHGFVTVVGVPHPEPWRVKPASNFPPEVAAMLADPEVRLEAAEGAVALVIKRLREQPDEKLVTMSRRALLAMLLDAQALGKRGAP